MYTFKIQHPLKRIFCLVFLCFFIISSVGNSQAFAQSSQSSPLVQKIQTVLGQLGYSPGQADGLIGTKTTNAIRLFQKQHKQSVDGKPTKNLLVALEKAVNRIQPDPGTQPDLGTKPVDPVVLSVQPPPVIPPPTLDPPDIARILKRGHLIVAMYHKDTAPFYYRDEQDKLTGIDVHLIKGFASQMGVGVTFDRSATSFKSVIDKVVEHQADLAISKLGMTFSRSMRIRYSKPYILLHQALLINRLELAKQLNGRSQSEVIRNFSGKLGVIAKSSYVDNAKTRFKKATVKAFDSWNKVVNASASGKVMAAYRDEVEIKKITRDNPDTALQFLTVVLTDAKDPKAIVVPWNSPNLLALINFYLDDLNLNLTANRILDNYDLVIQEIDSKIKARTK